MKYLAFLATLALACGGSDPHAIPATGGSEPHPAEMASGSGSSRIETSEGFSFAAPDGFSDEVQTQNGATVHVLKAPPDAVAVAAFVFVNEQVPATCDTPLTSSRGISGCLGNIQAKTGSAAFAIVHAGRAGVLVLAAKADSQAQQLAKAVADTIELQPVADTQGSSRRPGAQQIDPQFYGCFSSDSSFMDVVAVYSLCLRNDSTFMFQSDFRVGSTDGLSGEENGAAYGDGAEHGTWWTEPLNASDGRKHWNLHLRFSDGREATWEVRFYEGDLVRGEDQVWGRSRR